MYHRFAAYIARDPRTCTSSQHPHRDLDRDMFTHAQLTVPFFSDFTNVIGDQEHDSEGRGWFVPRFGRGIPKPWFELPMPHKEGQTVTLDSLLVHVRGA